MVLRRLDELAVANKDMAFETTLAGASLKGRIEAMRDQGYLLHLIYVWIYVWLASADMAVNRVAARVASGGHSIPESVIRRRYERSLSNFFDSYMPIADSWMMIDNSSRPLRWIAARDVGGETRIYDQSNWDRLRKRYMTPPKTAKEEMLARRPSFTTEDIFRAADEAVRHALRHHKELGQTVVQWRDGRVVWVKPEDIEV